MDDSNALPDPQQVADFSDASRTTPGSADIAETVAAGRRKIVHRLTSAMPRTAGQARRTGSALNRLAADAADECRQRIRERPINAVLVGVAFGWMLAFGLRRHST